MHNELCAHAPAGLALARVELLVQPGVIRDEIAAALGEGGWACEPIDARDLERVERENWNLVVIGGEQITHATLAASARASRNPRTRVLVVTPSREPQQIADVLGAGADDYVVHPFEPAELRARAQSLIAFSFSLPARRRFGSIGFDFAARTVFDGSTRVTLSPGEWAVLVSLLDADGEPVPMAVLARAVPREAGPASSVASTVSRLRRKLRAKGVRGLEIDTIGGRGYALQYRGRPGDL